MKRLSYFTPMFVAIFTVISLYTANAARLDWGQIIIPLIFAVCVAYLFMLIFWLLKWTSRNMPFVASIFTAAALLWYLITPYAGLALMVIALVFGIWKRFNLKLATNILCIVTLLAIFVSTGQAIIVNSTNQVKAQTNTIGTAAPGTPNIYFIVPDRMPSFAAMREAGIKCENFLTELKQRGFYVKEDQLSDDQYSASNPQDVHTTRTMRFFASVLNDGKEIPLEISYKECRTLIKANSIFPELHEQGYTVYNVASWFTETGQIPTANYNYYCDDVTLLDRFYQSELGAAFMSRTILNGFNFKLLQSGDSISRVEKNRHAWQASQTISISQNLYGRPHFVMTHLMLPHEPFVWCDTKVSQPEQYYQQIYYTQTYLIDLIDGIRTSDPNAIIIIQSDEGMAYKKPVELNYALTPVQWNGVLTAWYIPGADESELAELKHTGILNILQ